MKTRQPAAAANPAKGKASPSRNVSVPSAPSPASERTAADGSASSGSQGAREEGAGTLAKGGEENAGQGPRGRGKDSRPQVQAKVQAQGQSQRQHLGQDRHQDQRKGQVEASASKGQDKHPEIEDDEDASGRFEGEGARAGVSEEAKKAQAKLRGFKAARIVVIVTVILMVLVLIGFGAFSWNRWHRFDDAADIQGQWYAAGTPASIVIVDGRIQFNEKTSYAYTVDENTKTLSYTLANLEGEGHYWFSADREYLVIFDGDGFTKWGTAFDDLGRDIVNLFNSILGHELVLPEGDGIIALSRTPNSGGTSLPESTQGSRQSDSSSASQSQGHGQAQDDSPSEASSGASPSADSSEEATTSPEQGASGAASSGESAPKDMFSAVSDQAYDEPVRSAQAENSQEPADAQNGAAGES